MRSIGALGAVLAACASAAVVASPAAATPGPRDCNPFSAAASDTRYASRVLHDRPTHYWRLGGRGGTRDLVARGRTDVWAGSQVDLRAEGALACGWDAGVQLFGATPDDVWESHLVAGDEARTAAPGTSPFGIEIWVRPDTLDASSRRIVSRETAAGGYLLAARGDALVFSRFAAGDDGADRWSTVSVAPLPLHEWSHVVANYDDDGTMRLWVDGELAGQRASSLELPRDGWGQPDGPGGRFVIGAASRLWDPADDTTHAWLEWDGGLDEAAFYGRNADNLSPQEIRKHWRVGSGARGRE
jgi:hypothetical protein